MSVQKQNKLWDLGRRFVQETEGQDLVEYALLASLISLASIVAIGALGTAVTDVFQVIADQLAA